MLVTDYPVELQSCSILCFVLADELSSSRWSGVVIAYTDPKLFFGLSCCSFADDFGEDSFVAGSMTDLGLFITPLIIIREGVGNGIFITSSFSIRAWSCELVSSEGNDTLLVFSVSYIDLWSRSAGSTPVTGSRRSSGKV